MTGQIETLDDFRNHHQETCGGREAELRFLTVPCVSPDCAANRYSFGAHTHPGKLGRCEHLIVCVEGCGFHYVTDSSD